MSHPNEISLLPFLCNYIWSERLSSLLFYKTSKKPMWLIFNKETNLVSGEVSPLLHLCIALPPEMAALLFVLISLCPCKMHAGYFTIQTVAAISISNQDSFLQGFLLLLTQTCWIISILQSQCVKQRSSNWHSALGSSSHFNINWVCELFFLGLSFLFYKMARK